MKTEKLYTLSQFVDLVKKDLSDELDEVDNQKDEYGAHMSAYLRIEEYNDFLKQPLKKEMFVNEIEEPKENNYNMDSNLGYDAYYEDLLTWQEAEKKVIFKDYDFDIDRTLRQWTTLNGLAIATNGEAETKNIEL